MILDEPTTGLDAENERAVVQALERLTAGRTTFMVTHDAALAAAADVVLRIDGGRLAEEDSAARRGGEERHALSR